MYGSCHICGQHFGTKNSMSWTKPCDHMVMIQDAETFSSFKHKGQFISDGKPYTVHLGSVVGVLRRFGLNKSAEIEAACRTHDTVEDTDTTVEELREKFGNEVADIVWRVTDEPGKNRKERKAATYPKIKGHYKATAVKLCDRIANAEYDSGDDKQKFLHMYRSEYESFREGIYAPGICEELWDHLENFLFPDSDTAARYVSQSLLNQMMARRIWPLVQKYVGSRELFDEVMKRMSEPHRAYHTPEHLYNMLMEVFRVNGVEDEETRDLVLATLFHDIIYDVKNQIGISNEEQSASYLDSVYAGAYPRATKLVLATQKHIANTPLEELFLDIDLSILGADWERYERYAKQIRKEYSWVPEEMYKAKRKVILQSFLSRPKIFMTSHCEHLEVWARSNIAREIKELL